MSSVKQQEQSSTIDQTTQQRETETPPVKPSTTDRVVDSEYKVQPAKISPMAAAHTCPPSDD